jgi:hypothetical protein
MTESTHTFEEYKTLVKQIIELCKEGAKQSAKDNRDSVDTAASFANGRYVAYLEVLNLIENFKSEGTE